jgi:hypothetical protein
MMPNWNSKQVIADLSTLPYVSAVENTGQGGDVDTDNLVIHLMKDDRLFVCGFAPHESDHYIKTPADCEATHVELTDGDGEDCGLHSFTNKDLIETYGAIHTYFINRGFIVVHCLKDFY